MDEQKDNLDAVSDDSDSGVNITVKTAESNAEPAVNDTLAAPEPEVVIKDDDVAAVNSAVDGIATDSEEEGLEDSPTVGDKEESSPEVEESNSTDEPSLKEAPKTESDEPIESPDTSTEAKPDPFAEKKDDSSTAPATPTTPQSMSNNQQSLTHEHRNNKKFAVMITIIIAILMAGAAVYVYISAKDNTTDTSVKSPTSESTTTQVTETTPATSSDVEQAASDVDQTVQSIDDTTDLNEEAISDTALGL